MSENPELCPQCGQPVTRATSRFCSSCGTELPAPDSPIGDENVTEVPVVPDASSPESAAAEDDGDSGGEEDLDQEPAGSVTPSQDTGAGAREPGQEEVADTEASTAAVTVSSSGQTPYSGGPSWQDGVVDIQDLLKTNARLWVIAGVIVLILIIVIAGTCSSGGGESFTTSYSEQQESSSRSVSPPATSVRSATPAPVATPRASEDQKPEPEPTPVTSAAAPIRIPTPTPLPTPTAAPTPIPNVAGALDADFGSEGTVRVDTGGASVNRQSVTIQPDGKILVGTTSNNDGQGGDFTVLRFGADGNLDPSFGSSGSVITELGENYDEPVGLEVLLDGKILTASTRSRFLIRYHNNGEIDKTFGDNGFVAVPIPRRGSLTAIKLQPDGKLLVAAHDWDGGGPILFRFSPSGQLDQNFGDGGKIILSNSGVIGDVLAIAIQDNGQIVLGGPGDGIPRRYNVDGTKDKSFDATNQTSKLNNIRSMAIQPGGKIVVAGRTWVESATSAGFGLARYLSDGTLDASFGDSGNVITTFGTIESLPYSIATQKDGKIVAAGSVGIGWVGHKERRNFAVVRYTPDGDLDPSFGDGGVSETYIPEESEAQALAIQEDGNLVVVGYSRDRGDNSGQQKKALLALARYYGAIE